MKNVLCSLAVVLALSPFLLQAHEDTSMQVPLSADQIHPAHEGDLAADQDLRRTDDTVTTLGQELDGRRGVLIFYRGGWCPYCNRHLSELRTIEEDLESLGYRIIAISPDRPEKLQATLTEHDFSYTLLSDSSMKLSRALGIAFKVEDELVSKYKNEYGIDIEADSGETHHLLPVPAVIIVDESMRIQFVYTNPDYKVRMDADELLAEARALAGE